MEKQTMDKIIVASDSFKGSLTSMEVAEAAERGIRNVFPQCEVCKVEVADGGEGTAGVLVNALGGYMRTVKVSDPLGRPIEATYGILDRDGAKTAVMEMSAASGLPLLLPEERNPWETFTYGTGEMIRDAIVQGCRKFLIGIGGSATNDAGTGMLSALGVKFFDSSGRLLKGSGGDLKQIVRIDTSSLLPEVRSSEFVVACDVDTPFCGPQGAAYVFAPQKGATPPMVEALDEGMLSFAKLVAGSLGADIVSEKGAGAAGGLGGALKAFLSATLVRGIEMVLDVLSFDAVIQDADLIITGEGRVDAQTPKGKTPAGVLQHAQRFGIPVLLLGGSVEMCPELEEMGFAGIYPVTDAAVSLEQAMQKEFASANVTRTVEMVLRTLAFAMS